jgi:hypothetical protein
MDENEKFLERKRKFSSSFLDQEIEQVAPQNKFEVIIIKLFHLECFYNVHAI